MTLRVLIIDDERNIRLTLAALVESFGHHAHAAQSAAEAVVAVETLPFDVALLDLKLGNSSGLDLLPTLLDRAPGLQVVLMTAFASIPTAVDAIRRGARDYLPKPFEPEQVRVLLDDFARERALNQRIAELESRLEEVPEADFHTESPRMLAVYELARRAAPTETPVLLRGESGTGKSLLARFLHAHSPRAHGPFVVVNCPTLSEELLTSELFGHARGAFTGAIRDTQGRVEAASGGTLFLDEIGDLSPSVQAKLLRFLQDKHFERVGENRTRTANVRIVSATNRPLDTSRFRADLLYRLNVIELTLPPLRERREDLPALAQRYLETFSRAQKRMGMHFAPDVLPRLLGQPWPGNLRELRNAVERAVILSPGPEIGVVSFVGGAAPQGPALGDDMTLESLEREHILRVLARHGSPEEAARMLGIDPATLWRKRKRWESEG